MCPKERWHRRRHGGRSFATICSSGCRRICRRCSTIKLQAENDSLYNTPPVFAIYVLMLIARWLSNDMGGLAKMAEINREKAELLYDVLDQYPDFYRGHARPDSRSMMNVTWRLPSEELEKAFLEARQDRGTWLI